MKNRLNGLYPLAYGGVNAGEPPNVSVEDRDPLSTDYKGFAIGAIWVYPDTDRIYILTNKSAGVSTWLQISTAGGGDDVQALTADNGLDATPDGAGKINLNGSTNILTYAAGGGSSNFDIKLKDSIVVSNNVTVGGDLNAFKITSSALSPFQVVTTDTNSDLVSSNGGDGKILIGNSTGGVDWNTISVGSGLEIVNGHNSITIDTKGGDNGVIPGTMMEFEGTLPAGSSWLECDGSAVSQTTYSDLFANVGHLYYRVEFGSPFTVPMAPLKAYALASNYQTGTDAQWVIAGENGELYTSQDLSSWTVRTSNFGGDHIRAVAHNGLSGSDGLWVAVGANGKISTSSDGITWVARTSGNTNLHVHVVHNNKSGTDGLWVIAGVEMQYSSDGITWTDRTGDYVAQYTYFLDYRDGKWVAEYHRSGDAYYLTGSIDGKTWKIVQNMHSTYGYIMTASLGKNISLGTISYFSSSYHPAITNPMTLISRDGDWFWTGNFNNVAMGHGCEATSVLQGGGYFIITIDAGSSPDFPSFYYTTDGVNWTASTLTILSVGDSLTPKANNSKWNDEPSANDIWLAITSDNQTVYIGEAGTNLSTNFYLPSKPGYIICY